MADIRVTGMAGATSGRAYVYTLTSNNKHGNRQVQDNNALLCAVSGLCGNHVLRCLFLGEAELTPSPRPAQSPCSYSLSSRVDLYLARVHDA